MKRDYGEREWGISSKDGLVNHAEQCHRKDHADDEDAGDADTDAADQHGVACEQCKQTTKKNQIIRKINKPREAIDQKRDAGDESKMIGTVLMTINVIPNINSGHKDKQARTFHKTFHLSIAILEWNHR